MILNMNLLSFICPYPVTDCWDSSSHLVYLIINLDKVLNCWLLLTNDHVSEPEMSQMTFLKSFYWHALDELPFVDFFSIQFSDQLFSNCTWTHYFFNRIYTKLNTIPYTATVFNCYQLTKTYFHCVPLHLYANEW